MDLTHRPAKLCILSKWSPHFEGYGFDLMTKKSGEGHYISMVHEGGPAEATHLEAGDWLIEVNGINVEKFTHAEVIKLIKGSENGSVQLLLAPNETDKWRKHNQVPITSSHPDLVHYITPPYQGKLRSFINGALDRLVIGKRNESDDEPSVYHRYSLPIPSGMSDHDIVDWSPTGTSPNGQTNSMAIRRSTNDDGQLAGSLDEQRQKEIADWRDKSLEMLMASRVDEEQEDDGQDEEEDVHIQDENEISILSHEDEAIYKGSNGNNSRPVSGYQEKVLADIHLTDNNSSINNNSDISNNSNDTNNNGHKDDNCHITTITLLDGEFFARLCKIKKSSERSDYGFKMDSLPSGGGHFLRSIEPTGPAGVSGIQQNDRLIEVNNVNVEYTDHDTVVTMIRKSPDCEVTLLVVDDKSFKWFKSRNIRIHHGSGGSLIRYCDHRGLREPGYNFERPASVVEENRRSQLYRRGLSNQSATGDERSAGNSSDIESDVKDEDKHLSIKLRPQNGVDTNDDDDGGDDDESIRRDQVTMRQSTATTVTTSTDTRGSSGLDQQQKQRESRSSQISDWSYGSLNDVDRFNRGKTIIKVPDDAPRPRLCSITKDPDGIFGFTLNTYEKGRIKLIAEIDKGSSAEAAGLLQWDRVIEVNGVNINIENHAQVTGRIEASGNRLHLLVLPEAQYGWYERAGLVPRSNQSNVIYLSNTDVTRDSITIARSLEHSGPIVDNKKYKTNTKQNSPKKSSSSPISITTTTPSSTTMTTSTPESTSYNKIKGSSSITTDNNDNNDNYEDSESQLTMEMIKMRKEDQIKKPFQSNVNSYQVNEENNVNESNRNSTISHMIQYHTIDEETTEAIYDHRETHEVSTLPMRNPKKKSLTKRIFRGSIFSSKKDKLYPGSGSISNLSIKSDIVVRGSSSTSDLSLDAKSRTLGRSVTQINNRLDEDEEEYQLRKEFDQDHENNVVTVMVKRDVQDKPMAAWSTSNNNNNHKIISDIHDNNNGFTGNQNHVLTRGDGGGNEDQQDESQLLERLKSLTLRDVRQTTRAESKIQAYQRMSSLNFSQRIQHFEDL